LRKLNIKLIDVKIRIRRLIVAKVVEKTRQVEDSVLPHYEICTPADAQKKLYEFLCMCLSLLLKR
jgi:hypothetical protein